MLKVVDRHGRVLEDNRPSQTPALDRQVAAQMVDLMKGMISRGTGRGARIGGAAAGKTGTSDDYRNAWFIGFTPYLSAAVWVGNDDNTPMRRVVGGTVPAGIWASFMRVAVRAMPADDWEGLPEQEIALGPRPTHVISARSIASFIEAFFGRQRRRPPPDDEAKDRPRDRQERRRKGNG